MALSAADSSAVFSARMKEAQLGAYIAKFEEMGWLSYSSFAFATSSLEKPSEEKFDEQVLKTLFGQAVHPLASKVRKLFLEYWAIATEEMKNVTRPSEAVRLPMHPEDRRIGIARVRAKVDPVFKMIGDDEPSTHLINDCFAILQHEATVHVRWETCTSKRQELRDPKQRVDPGLVLHEGGIFKPAKQDVPSTDLSEMGRWIDAMSRRGCALDIAGLLEYDLHARWIKMLRAAYNESAHRGYQRVTWEQLLEADVALFEFIEEKAEHGPRCRPGEQVTEFQKWWVKGLESRQVERHLEQRQAPSGSAGHHSDGPSAALASASRPAARASESEVGKLQRKLENKERENANLKRKLNADGGGAAGQRGNRAGKDRRKGDKGGKR